MQEPICHMHILGSAHGRAAGCDVQAWPQVLCHNIIMSGEVYRHMGTFLSHILEASNWKINATIASGASESHLHATQLREKPNMNKV